MRSAYDRLAEIVDQNFADGEQREQPNDFGLYVDLVVLVHIIKLQE